jgi:hypothetical protein
MPTTPVATTPQFKDTLGDLYLIPGAVPVPPKPTSPPIPSTAKNTGSIIAIPGWKMEWDSGTQGSASNIKMVYDPVKKIATFSANQKGKAGVRWSVHAAENIPDTVKNFCYDITFEFPDPTQQACIEMDVNQVTSDDKTYLLCVQASEYSHSYEYTLLNKSGFGWNKSNIPSNPEQWPKNTKKHIRIFSHRDNSSGVYYQGVEEDNIYIPFAASCQGISAQNLGWKPTGMILPNFQMDGSTDAGTMIAVVHDFNISYW